MIWKANAPPRTSFFTWKAAKERILTLDNLMKRGIPLTNRCFLCNCNEESCNHILLWCPLTHNLWTLVYSLLGISWVIAGSVKSELLAWDGLYKKNKSSRLIPLTIFWVIWKERNNKAFDGKEVNFCNIKNRWFHYFGSILLAHNLDNLDDLGSIVYMLIDL